MISKEVYRHVIQAYVRAFPSMTPDPKWLGMWSDKYSPSEIIAVIEEVAAKRFSGKSASDIGRIISATLRDNAKSAVIQEVLDETVHAGALPKQSRGNGELVCGKCVFLGKPCNNHGGRRQ